MCVCVHCVKLLTLMGTNVARDKHTYAPEITLIEYVL